MLIGYARVSTSEQNLQLQHAALTQAGCEKIFEDKVTGPAKLRPWKDMARSRSAPTNTAQLH